MDNTGIGPIISAVATVAAAAAVITFTVIRTTAVVVIIISTVRRAATLPLMTVVITITSTFRFGPLFEPSKQVCVVCAHIMVTELTSVS